MKNNIARNMNLKIRCWKNRSYKRKNKTECRLFIPAYCNSDRKTVRDCEWRICGKYDEEILDFLFCKISLFLVFFSFSVFFRTQKVISHTMYHHRRWLHVISHLITTHLTIRPIAYHHISHLISSLLTVYHLIFHLAAIEYTTTWYRKAVSKL
jgi:hypothetical protein